MNRTPKPCLSFAAVRNHRRNSEASGWFVAQIYASIEWQAAPANMKFGIGRKSVSAHVVRVRQLIIMEWKFGLEECQALDVQHL